MINVLPVTAVFDVGKTNKKLFLFDEDYRIVYEKSARFNETVDEDGFVCENLDSLKLSVYDSLREVFKLKQFLIKAVNFSTYGASFVYLSADGGVLTALYNYLKPYPQQLKKQFYDQYGDEQMFCSETASPALGSLNSGLQLYRLKHEQPDVFNNIKYALHLPQYLSYLLTGQCYTDMTSLGCHTSLWDYTNNQYHYWVKQEGIIEKLAPILPATTALQATFPGTSYQVGIGLHDSSAALIPYLISFTEPFILLSTGTWCISLNPFNNEPLTALELMYDCLYYLQYLGKPVKASRLFTGYEYEHQVKRIADYFSQNLVKYRNVAFSIDVYKKLAKSDQNKGRDRKFRKTSVFAERNLSDFGNDVEAYHQLLMDIVNLQKFSTGLINKNGKVKRIFVDGGFSKNAVFMQLLAYAFPDMEVFAASVAQATAVGTALCIHHSWNSKPVPNDLIQLKYYSATSKATL